MGQFQNNRCKVNKEQALNYLGGKRCYRCDEDSLSYAAYDFHHYKGGKKHNISRMLAGSFSKAEIEAELDLCVVLCRNCHAEVHAYNIKITI